MKLKWLSIPDKEFGTQTTSELSVWTLFQGRIFCPSMNYKCTEDIGRTLAHTFKKHLCLEKNNVLLTRSWL